MTLRDGGYVWWRGVVTVSEIETDSNSGRFRSAGRLRLIRAQQAGVVVVISMGSHYLFGAAIKLPRTGMQG